MPTILKVLFCNLKLRIYLGTANSAPRKKQIPDFSAIHLCKGLDSFITLKVSKSDYETGSRELMKAYGIDRDAVIAQSNTPEFIKLREDIYHSLRIQWKLHEPANSAKVYSLVDTLYRESFEKQGADLGVFHSVGTLLAAQGNLTRKLDDSYGKGFSAFLAEAIFIYCFIQSLPSNEEEQTTE